MIKKDLLVRKWQVFIVVVLSITLLAVVAPLVGQAQNTDDAISLGISPQVLDLTVNPGEKISNTFRLTNASDEAVVIKVIPKNFTPRGEEGAVDLTVDDTTYSLAEWIDVSPTETIVESKKTADFDVSIQVPEDAEPGSHFGSVVFQTIPPEQEGSAALVSQEIAPVILVRVAGDIKEDAEIIELKTTKSFYSLENNVELLSRIKNTGSVHFKPTGRLVIKNMLGNEVANLELDKRNVLPDSIRQISTTWASEGLKFGRYTATLTLVFGDEDQIRTSEHSFYYFPYQIILPFIIVIVLIVYVFVRYRGRLAKALRVLSGKDTEK